MQSDRELITQIRNGSTKAFDILMSRYQNTVFRIALSYGKTRENALDISQNVFLRVYQRLDSFKGNSLFHTWLIRVACNESINWAKKHKRHLNNELFDESNGLSFSGKNQEQEMMNKEQRIHLLRSMQELNTRYRLAVVLRYFENMPVKQIAETMECSEGMVKNMLFRSLRKMRKHISTVG